MAMTSKQVQTRTYVTPGRVVTAMEKQGLRTKGDHAVRYVISKTADGRYFPVFLGAGPAQDQDQEKPTRRRAAAKAPSKRASTKKVTKKGTVH